MSVIVVPLSSSRLAWTRLFRQRPQAWTTYWHADSIDPLVVAARLQTAFGRRGDAPPRNAERVAADKAYLMGVVRAERERRAYSTGNEFSVTLKS